MNTSIYRYFAWFVFLCAVIWGALYQYSSIDMPLGFDEVDYYDASKVGFLDQWLCRSESSFLQFLELAYGKYNRLSIDFAIENEDRDLFLLKHFHGVFPTYYWNILIAISDWFSWKVDLVLRVGNILLFLTLVGYLVVALKERSNLVIALPLLGIACVSPWFYESYYALNFHVFLGLVSLFFWHKLVVFLEDDSRRNILWLSCALIIMLLTLETFVVVLGLSVLVIWHVYRQRFVWRNLIWFVILAILFLLVLNPGTFKSWDFIKSWFMYAYRIGLKSNQEYAGVSPGQVWIAMLKDNALYFVTLLGLMVLAWKHRLREVILPSFVGGGYLLFITFFSISNSYFFPGFVLLTLSGALVLVSDKIRWEALLQASLLGLAMAALSIVVVTVDLTERSLLTQRFAETHRQDMDYISGRIKSDQQGLSEVNHILNKYSDVHHAKKLVVEANGELLVRINYQNISFKEYQRRSHVHYLILRKEKVSVESLQALLALNYQLIELNHYTLFQKP